jgi:hypothetical protein
LAVSLFKGDFLFFEKKLSKRNQAKNTHGAVIHLLKNLLHHKKPWAVIAIVMGIIAQPSNHIFFPSIQIY